MDDWTGMFEQHRRLLLTIAYGIVGTVTDAEDVVQDSWLRWSTGDRSEVVEPRAYLVQITTRVALNRLRTLKRRRETYVGPWLPEPVLTEDDGPADRLETGAELSIALLVVLESLSPRERAVFVLHQVFGYPYAEIAGMLDSTDAAVRQTGHRAREHVQARRPRFVADRQTHRRLFERFAEACATGDVDRLLAVLAPDVVFISDGGGRVSAALKPVVGAQKVARLLLGLAGQDVPGLRTELRTVNGRPAAVGWTDGAPFVLVQIEIDDQSVSQVLMLRNPDKLSALVATPDHLPRRGETDEPGHEQRTGGQPDEMLDHDHRAHSP